MNLLQQQQKTHMIIEKIKALLDAGYNIDEIENILLKDYDLTTITKALILSIGHE